MKLFAAILFAAGVVGGLVGGELADDGFSWTGAAVGVVGTGATIFGLGAFFDAQAKRDRDQELPPEIRAVFARMLGGHPPATPPAPPRKPAARRPPSAARPLPEDAAFQNEILGLVAQFRAEDAALIARGEVPERRLIPHDSLKRDVVVAAYRKDLGAAVAHVNAMAWTQAQKQKQFEEVRRDFSRQMDRIKRLTPDELDDLIAHMKQTRVDMKELEGKVRKEHSWYSIVGPL